MKRIYKYELKADPGFVVNMPKYAEILCVQVQGDTPCIWASVDPDEPMQSRVFEIVPTGSAIPDYAKLNYLGTFQLLGGAIVFHVFERTIL